MRSLCLLAASLALAAAPLGAQKLFVTTTSLVNVAFSAHTALGGLVTGLQAGDLSVTENGVPQTIAFFSPAPQMPLTLGIILDMSGSQHDSLKQHRYDLERFLGHLLTPDDHAFLVGFADHIRLLSDYTSYSPSLLWALDHYRSRYAYPLLGPLSGPNADRDGGTALYDAIDYAITEKMARQPGRRALLVFSDGEDNSSAHDEQDAVTAAENNDTTIFTVRYTEDHKWDSSDVQGMEVMNHLASATGGRAVDARRVQPAVYLAAIAGELRASYDLAYYPHGDSAPGYRRILIRCHRPGVIISARAGYTPHSPD
ncbi:MAG: VWA domain-containing protein [Terriglobales bacterium]